MLLTLRRPDSGGPGLSLPAQLDTGADRTVIPGRSVEELGLVRVREIPILGFGGQLAVVPTFAVEVSIHEARPRVIEAIAEADEPYCLLGRDILNGLRITLDGPRLTMEIE